MLPVSSSPPCSAPISTVRWLTSLSAHHTTSVLAVRRSKAKLQRATHPSPVNPVPNLVLRWERIHLWLNEIGREHFWLETIADREEGALGQSTHSQVDARYGRRRTILTRGRRPSSACPVVRSKTREAHPRNCSTNRTPFLHSLPADSSNLPTTHVALHANLSALSTSSATREPARQRVWDSGRRRALAKAKQRLRDHRLTSLPPGLRRDICRRRYRPSTPRTGLDGQAMT